MSDEPVIIRKCCGVFGFIFGHKFKGRFDQHSTAGKPPLEQMRINTGILSEETLSDVFEKIGEAYRSRQTVYIQDICTRCGTTIPRKVQP